MARAGRQNALTQTLKVLRIEPSQIELGQPGDVVTWTCAQIRLRRGELAPRSIALVIRMGRFPGVEADQIEIVSLQKIQVRAVVEGMRRRLDVHVYQVIPGMRARQEDRSSAGIRKIPRILLADDERAHRAGRRWTLGGHLACVRHVDAEQNRER